MAEQDRKDAIPCVLNDLIDVDGEPADGDGLVRSGGAWVPAVGAAGNVNGPKRTIYETTTTGLSVVNDYARIGVEPTNDYANWTPWDILEDVGNEPGEWVLDQGRYKYRFTRAGIFNVTSELDPVITGGNHVAGNTLYHRIDEALGIVFQGGRPRASYSGLIGATYSLGLANSTLPFRVPQELVDVGGSHLDFGVFFMRASGSTVIETLSAYITVDQWSPDDHAPAFGM